MSVKRCVEAFTVWRDGTPITFTAGQLLEDRHPILKSHAHLFQDVETAARPRQAQRVEATVNEPGSLRTLTPPPAPPAVPDPPAEPEQPVVPEEPTPSAVPEPTAETPAPKPAVKKTPARRSRRS